MFGELYFSDDGEPVFYTSAGHRQDLINDFAKEDYRLIPYEPLLMSEPRFYHFKKKRYAASLFEIAEHENMSTATVAAMMNNFENFWKPIE